MIFFWYVLYSIGALWVLWILFICVMGLQRVKDAGKLAPQAKFFGYPTLMLGLIVDFICNVFVMTPLLLELPIEMTCTARLKRHHQDNNGETWRSRWQLDVVRWFQPLLDPFDPNPGGHI